ncbi:unnamed protein product, partial [marine sediment metagenome]
KTDSNHDFWQRGYYLHTEEDIGIDKKGKKTRRPEKFARKLKKFYWKS